MKVVIGNYPDPTDSRNLILNAEVSNISPSQPGSVLFAIISKIEGIETAPFRNGTGDWSGADGGYISSQLYSARTITISGTYIDRRAGCDYSNTNVDQFDHLARLYIRSRLPIRKKQYIRLFMDSGMTFYTEGYCVDIKMDYTFIGHGEYQIAMYCPDPALYRGDQDGSIGSEWNSAVLRKENNAGYVSAYTDSLGDHYYASMGKVDDDPHGFIWNTGGRSTPIEYAGDFPYYPQFIIEPKPGEQAVNPSFMSLNEGKTFGLGYPETEIAQYEVTANPETGAIVSLTPISQGAYDGNFSSTYIFQNLRGSNLGSGAKARLTMEKQDDRWTISNVQMLDAGTGYTTGDIISPSIPEATILVIASGDRCVIDMSEHTVTLNGESISHYITAGSEWFQLDPLMTNGIVFTSANDDDVSVSVRWRNGYSGV